MNRESTRKRRVQKTLGLHYSRFYVIALCIDSRFRHKILENCSQAAPVEKVGLRTLVNGDAFRSLRLGGSKTVPCAGSLGFSPASPRSGRACRAAPRSSRRDFSCAPR